MKRTFITGALALVFVSSFQALSLNWPVFINMVFLPPIILIFSLQNFKLMETIYLSLLVGLMTDIMGGFMIGINMLLMLLTSFVLVSLNLSSGRIYQSEIIYYVMGVSFVYRILLLITELILVGARINFSILGLLLGPIIDGLLSSFFYYLLIKALSKALVFDRADYLRKEGIGRFR